MKDMVNHPDHYGGKDDPYEVIKVLEAWGLDKDAYLFNVVKYVARAGKKPEQPVVQDLKKALWYLERKIKSLVVVDDSGVSQQKIGGALLYKVVRPICGFEEGDVIKITHGSTEAFGSIHYKCSKVVRLPNGFECRGEGSYLLPLYAVTEGDVVPCMFTDVP